MLKTGQLLIIAYDHIKIFLFKLLFTMRGGMLTKQKGKWHTVDVLLLLELDARNLLGNKFYTHVIHDEEDMKLSILKCK